MIFSVWAPSAKSVELVSPARRVALAVDDKGY